MTKEEVIFKGFDTGWRCELPVTLITYESGVMDIHRQTGNQFQEDIDQALKILTERGIVLNPEEKHWMFGSTGAYRTVVRVGGNK